MYEYSSTESFAGHEEIAQSLQFHVRKFIPILIHLIYMWTFGINISSHVS